MQEDTSFRGDVIGLCISIKGRHTEGKGRHQRGLSSSLYNYSFEHELVYPDKTGMEEMWLSDSLNLTILEPVADLHGPVQLENLFYNKLITL